MSCCKVPSYKLATLSFFQYLQVSLSVTGVLKNNDIVYFKVNSTTSPTSRPTASLQNPSVCVSLHSIGSNIPRRKPASESTLSKLREKVIKKSPSTLQELQLLVHSIPKGNEVSSIQTVKSAGIRNCEKHSGCNAVFKVPDETLCAPRKLSNTSTSFCHAPTASIMADSLCHRPSSYNQTDCSKNSSLKTLEDQQSKNCKAHFPFFEPGRVEAFPRLPFKNSQPSTSSRKEDSTLPTNAENISNHFKFTEKKGTAIAGILAV